MTTDIALRCFGCARPDAKYSRDIDPDIPERVVLITMSSCDKCDRGDFSSERWFDANGQEVGQAL